MPQESVKPDFLIGKIVKIHVKETPCIVRANDFEPLTETVEGVVLRIAPMPGGPIMFIRTDDGRRISLDVGFDVSLGKIEIEVIDVTDDGSPQVVS